MKVHVDSSWPEWVLPGLRTFLEGRDVHKLYSHQVALAEHAWQGNDVVVVNYGGKLSASQSSGSNKPVSWACACLSKVSVTWPNDCEADSLPSHPTWWSITAASCRPRNRWAT